ncbi:MAG: apolipoprotein N-acyltransferase [Bacteroidales bacterium]
MRNTRLLVLTSLSGILLSLPWFEYFSGIILFIAFIPLLFVEDYLYLKEQENRPYVLLGYAFMAFLIWNILSTFWIAKISFGGAAVVILFNAFLMSLFFFLYHLTKRNLGRNFGNFSLLVYWVGWEYLFMNTEITWPWLNLGNGFAKDINLIQWYEFTGILGGTLWILAINLVLFNILKFYILHKSIRAQLGQVLFFLLLLFLPVTVSIIAFNSYQIDKNPVKIGVLQPNVDPYEEKFEELTNSQQIDIMLNLADSIADNRMDYLIGPETAVAEVNLDSLENDKLIQSFDEMVEDYPDLHIVLGLDGYRNYNSKQEAPRTARQRSDKNGFYAVYNSAIQIDSSRIYPVYHKSKLVSGVEKMPYSGLLQFTENFVLDIGGTKGSKTIQENRKNFTHLSSQYEVAPVICYESVFGEHVTAYVKQGADLIFIITNDGWLRKPGYLQHLHFARLRAIETRRDIARSANTGISAFINQKGQLLKTTEWWEKDAVKGTMNANDNQTFYVEYGDYIGRVSIFLAVFALLYLVAKMLMKRTKNAELLLRLRE